MMLDTKLEPAIAKDMLRGAADPLWSEFRLGYAGCACQRSSCLPHFWLLCLLPVQSTIETIPSCEILTHYVLLQAQVERGSTRRAQLDSCKRLQPASLEHATLCCRAAC
jgi:hypothetical protein